jgi:hypothetical protein
MRLGLAALCVASLLAGCLGASPSSPKAGDTPPPTLPPVGAFGFDAPVDLGTVQQGAEPGVAVAPDGTIYVTTPVALWRSDDGGATYQALGESVCTGLPTCSNEGNPGLAGNGDAAIAVSPNGTVHWLGLAANSVPFQSSHDRGATWTPAQELHGAPNNFTDREWITVGRDGRLLASWNSADALDCAVEEPTCVPSVDQTVDIARPHDDRYALLRTSDDGGATWGGKVRIAPGYVGGPVAADQGSDRMLVAFTLGGGLWASRSVDGGSTWQLSLVTLLGHEPYGMLVAAFDDAGTAYLAWSADPSVPTDRLDYLTTHNLGIPSIHLATSHDGGATWSKPRAVSPQGVPAVMPWLVAGAPGRVGLAWYQGDLPVPGERVPDVWRVNVAVGSGADGDAPSFTVATVGGPNHLGPICTQGLFCTSDRSLLDFFQLAIRPDGGLVVAYAADADAHGVATRVMAARSDVGSLLR